MALSPYHLLQLGRSASTAMAVRGLWGPSYENWLDVPEPLRETLLGLHEDLMGLWAHFLPSTVLAT